MFNISSLSVFPTESKILPKSYSIHVQNAEEQYNFLSPCVISVIKSLRFSLLNPLSAINMMTQLQKQKEFVIGKITNDEFVCYTLWDIGMMKKKFAKDHTPRKL